MWGQMDSNHRRHSPADLQSAPFGRSGISPKFCISVERFTEIVRKSSSFFDFRKTLVKKNVINFNYSLIPKLNAVNSGPFPFWNSGAKS
jgi:hypothetical protein